MTYEDYTRENFYHEREEQFQRDLMDIDLDYKQLEITTL